MRLSQGEINARMVELSNLRRLYATQKTRLGMFKEENKKLKERVAFLESAYAGQQTINAELRLQMEELRTMVFGKKRKKADRDIDDNPPQSASRTADSYKRPLPKESDVTETKDHPIDACSNCHGHFSERESVVYFEEDIPLPQKKTVIRHIVQKGYCASCKRWSAGAPLPAAKVVLGRNTKRYVAYLSVVCRQSYSQVQDVLKQTYEFDISEGEIAKILEKEGNRLRPEYERLKARIRGEPSVHLDETGWNLFMGDGFRRYAWTMVGGVSGESVFTLGKTRGKGNAVGLLGDSGAVLVSDDYAAYRDRDKHQLCCAHILRKLRDLARSGEIEGEVHDRCVHAYETFAGIYADIEEARTSKNPASAHDPLLKRLRSFSTPDPADCAKLARIRKQVADRAENYLTCLLHPSVAADNNAAERSLRHVVLKRKISFGSLSEKTAGTLAILLSVLLSLKRRGELRSYLMGV